MTDGSRGHDAATLENRVFSYYRAISMHELLRTFKPGDSLLELGGGTGEEAVRLAEKGIRVLVTDISPSQIALARKRIGAGGHEGMLEARVLGIDDISSLSRERGDGAFDGAYSSFGALNCAGELGRLPSVLHALVRPEGRVVCSVMNRTCGWEMLAGMATLRPGRAFRRLGIRKAAIEGIPGASFDVRYYLPGDIAAIFRPMVEIERMSDHPLLPPPYLDRVFRKLPRYLEWASRRDDGLLRGLGDHLFFCMRRRELA